MRNRILILTNLIFISAAIVVIALSFFSYKTINRQIRASDEVQRTQLLKFKLNDAYSHVVKTESAQRGFILTHDTAFLEDYFLAQKQIPGLLSDIEVLITRNEEQVNNLKLATLLFNNRLKYIQSVLSNHDKISAVELDSTLLEGKQLSNELNQRIDQMIMTEDLLLINRITVKKIEERYTAMLILLLSVLSTSILIFSFFRLKSEILSNRNLQQKVSERTEEINIANEILSEQNDELKRKNQELSSFNFVANHDLKEPLRKIELFTNKVNDSEDNLSPENKTMLEKSLQCVKRMKALLEDVYYYSLTDKPNLFKITDLNKTADAAIKNLQEVISEKGAIIQYSRLPEINAVPQQMEQLFTNLISNSLKYSKKQIAPYIKIEAELIKENKQRSWKIAFTDNGIGFNEDYRDKIFEMFQRLHPRNIYQGTGIGLTICKKIVENHHGTITASSKDGEGAVFTIVLPEKPPHHHFIDKMTHQLDFESIKAGNLLQ